MNDEDEDDVVWRSQRSLVEQERHAWNYRFSECLSENGKLELLGGLWCFMYSCQVVVPAVKIRALQDEFEDPNLPFPSSEGVSSITVPHTICHV